MAVSATQLRDIHIPGRAEGGSPELRGVLGVPEGTGPFPAVVVMHEAFGADEQMRLQVAKLTSLGYLTLMPDLYSMGGTRKCLIATARALRSGTGRAYADIESARVLLLERPDANGSVGVIGFCMGGGFALMTAADHGFDAAASNYGLLPRDLDAALEHACPIVGSYGGADRSLKGAAAKLETTLSRHGIPHDLKEYPGAGHQFMNTTVNGPAVFRPFARVSGFGPNPDAAADAWQRIDAFFREHLVPPAG
ncbi:MAG: dienelactone hydrolase family protein [Pseudolysinimonas sp.]|uniref:dienelactone hydrolase family protein n=1 Tax=Pseudolysinimonas sp. TaxID=2680009 RepID=UPI003267B391